MLEGEFEPGMRLSVPDLARRLGVSRTPVREALFVLERDGLIVVRPRRGAVVFGGGRSDLDELFELREALDGMAARLAAERMTDDERAQLASILEQHDAALDASKVDEHVRLDVAFHEHLRSACRNERIAEALLRLQDQMAMVIRLSASTPGAMGEGVRTDHRAILDAVLSGDATKAERAARAHVRHIARFMSTNYSGPLGTEPSDAFPVDVSKVGAR
jgi:DNA-binding GntR family transcriptional regulator